MATQFTSNLIPGRFLMLVSHLTVLIIILWSNEESSKACLPYDHEGYELTEQIWRMKWGISLALSFIVIELLGFLTGLSMFHSSYAILNIGCHGLATLTLSLALMQTWSCSLFWWLFTFCSVLPVTIEIIIMFNTLVLRKESL